MNKTLSNKMDIKENARCYFQKVPDDFCGMIQSPPLNISNRLEGKFDYIHIFTIFETELDKSIKKLKPYLSERGNLWISWPKSKKLSTDLSLPIVIKTIYQNGMVESKVISIDNTWSAIKVTRPIKGKLYNNSYGILSQENLIQKPDE